MSSVQNLQQPVQSDEERAHLCDSDADMPRSRSLDEARGLHQMNITVAQRVQLGVALAAIMLAVIMAVCWLPAHLQTRPSWPGHAAYVATGTAFVVSDVLWLRVLATAANVFTITFSCACSLFKEFVVDL